MNLPILLFLGILNAVSAIYKIPEHDACVLKVLLCDDFTKPLTPVDNSTLEMFKSIEQLNAVCDELSKFRICLKNAEIFCTENANLDVGFELLKNRRLAFDLCERNSAHQHVYMMVEGCVNQYSHSAIEFCTDKAVETVGLDFDLGDYERECRFLGAIQHCHIAVVTDQCGSIAGNMLEKLVVFRGERDFMCIGYENERLKNLEAFYAIMDSYVQQYRNTVYQIEAEEEVKRTDGMRSFNTQPQEASSHFHSRISLISDENSVSDIKYTSNRKEPMNLEKSYYPEKQSLSSLSQNRLLDSEYTPQNTVRHTRRFYEQWTDKISDENSACKTKASFLLRGIRSNGERYELGFGEADVLWATFLPLKDVSCAWLVNPSTPTPLTKCSILIHNSLVSRKGCKTEMECDLPSNATLAVYETVNGRKFKRVADLRVHSFLKYSSTLERRSDDVINFFKNHAHDIRFWCTDQREANLNKELNRAHSTSRMGLASYVHKYGTVSEHGRISDHKRNFYKPEQSEYPIDTEIHLISSEEGNPENKFEIGDNYAPQNHGDNLDFFFSDEMLGETNYDEPSTSAPPKLSFRSYRPYEQYRPRVGETLEADYHDMSHKDTGRKEAEECSFNPNVLSFEDSSKNGYTNHPYVEEMCPELPENISKLVNKPGRYSRDFMNLADPIEKKSKRYKKFSSSKTSKDIPLCKMIWKADEPENSAPDIKQNQYEDIYVVTPSTEIETPSVPIWTISQDADMQNVVENSQILNKKDDSQEFFEVSQESNSKDLKPEMPKAKISGVLISDYQNDKHPFSEKFIDSSTKHENEQFSPKSEVFSERSGQRYRNEIDEKISDALKLRKLLVKIESDMTKILKAMQRNNSGLRKLEL